MEGIRPLLPLAKMNVCWLTGVKKGVLMKYMSVDARVV